MFPERREYPIFYLGGGDVASVRTAEPVHSRRTAEVDDAAFSSPHDHPGATGPADDQTRQQVLWSPVKVCVGPSRDCTPSKRSNKKVRGHNGKFGHILGDPLIRRVRLRLPFAGTGVFHEALRL